jgi:hypothetical protein
MDCEFQIPISLPIKDILKKTAVAVKYNGGEFIPTENGGSFIVPTILGRVVGNFELIEGNVSVKIAEKPFFISCDAIQDVLTRRISGASF